MIFLFFNHFHVKHEYSKTSSILLIRCSVQEIILSEQCSYSGFSSMSRRMVLTCLRSNIARFGPVFAQNGDEYFWSSFLSIFMYDLLDLILLYLVFELYKQYSNRPSGVFIGFDFNASILFWAITDRNLKKTWKSIPLSDFSISCKKKKRNYEVKLYLCFIQIRKW